MKIVFLGTGSMQPTKERNVSSIYFNHESENILFDCGEGTQRQMRLKEISPTKITKIIVSHFHADHVLGLGGLLRTLEANEYNKTITIYGPKGVEKFVHNIIHSAYYGDSIKIKTIEIKPGIIINEEKFTVEAFQLDHSVPSFGFRLKEKDRRKINLEYLKKFELKQHPLLGELQKGKDIVWNDKKITAKKATNVVKGKIISIIFDTGYFNNIIKLAKDADLLISESTFSIEEKDKAREYKHLTAEDAAKIAKKSKAKKLILTHFSPRYKDISKLQKEAEKEFNSVECASDLMEINI
ncbi:ribonuclease Z [Candidatus Woesearchaeota archaeon]|nr:ribonuclease Z [Candidatus Woesearchaeota archaeon]